MMRNLTLEIAKKNVGKYIDCYTRRFGYYPMQIIEINGILYLKDRTETCMQIPESKTDFNCHTYDYIFTMEETAEEILEDE